MEANAKESSHLVLQQTKINTRRKVFVKYEKSLPETKIL